MFYYISQEDQEFIREISVLSNREMDVENKNISDIDFSFFDQFELKEELTSSHKSDSDIKTNNTSSNKLNGWKSGFLNNQTSRVQKKKSTINNRNTVDNSSEEKDYLVKQVDLKSVKMEQSVADINNNNNSNNSTNIHHQVQYDVLGTKDQSKNVPFNGNILERFP